MSHLPRQGQELMFHPLETPTELLNDTVYSPQSKITHQALRAAYDHPGPHIDVDQRKSGLQEIVDDFNVANRNYGFITTSTHNPTIQARYGSHLSSIQDHAVAKYNSVLRHAKNRFTDIQQKNDLISAGFEPQAVDNAIEKDWRELMASYGPGVSHVNDRKIFIGNLAARSSLAKAAERAAKNQKSTKSH